MDEELKKRIAVFRFGVIADFVGDRPLARGKTEELMKEKCDRKWQIPGSIRTSISESTVKEWACRYKRSGNKLESLYPLLKAPTSGGAIRQGQAPGHRTRDGCRADNPP